MLLLLVLIFITFFMIVFNILKIFVIKPKSIGRLNKYTNIEHMEIKENKKKSNKIEYKSGLMFISKRIGNVKFLDNYKNSIQSQLSRAHIMLKSEEFITIMLISMFVPAFICLVATGNLFYSLFVGMISLFIPNLVLKRKISKRLRYLNEQLSDAISLISNSLKAGYSFLQAVETVSNEMVGPIAEEFEILKKEVCFGTKTEIALEKLSKRVASDDLDLVITAVLIQRNTGGNLSEILDNICSTIRQRVKIKGDISAMTAQGRMSGIVIALLPVALFFMMFLMDRENVMVLFTDPIGIAIVVVSVVMEIIGIACIKKIVTIEV